MPAYLWHADTFATHSRKSQLAFGVFYGFIVALVLYNLMLFLSVRDRLYLYYVLHGSTLVGWLSAIDGFVFEYLGTEGGWWPNNGLATSGSLALMFGAQMTRGFLDTPRSAPWSDRILMTFVVIGGLFLAICAATGWLVPYQAVLASISAIALLLTATVLFVGVRALSAVYRSARFFLLAWAASQAA